MLMLLEYLRNSLESDPVLNELLSKYGEPGEELPAIAYQVAPQDMLMPYIVTNVLPAQESNPSLNRIIYTMDIYVDKGDIVTASILADRLELLYDRRRLPDGIGVGMWRDSNHPIPNEEDPEVQHIHVSFIVKYNRIY